ncbi:MAG: trigger factor [Candidatus Paceibacterota bacterium]
MKYEIKELPGSKLKIEVELTPDEFEVFYKQGLNGLASEAEMPGFRKGKVPAGMVEEKLKPEALLSEASELAIRDTWIKILKESKIEAISQPNVEITKVAKGNPFIFSLEVDILPKVELPDIRKIAAEVKAEEVKVDDKEVEDTLNWLRQSRAKLSQKEGAAQSGDLVEFVFKFLDGPMDLPKTEQKDGFIIGKGHYIEGLEEALLGIKAEEEKEFEGQIALGTKGEKKEKIKAWVKAESVKKVELPELTDDWAKTLGAFENMEALKADIRKGIKDEKEAASSEKKRAEILEKISAKTKVDVPEILIEREEHALFDNLKNRVSVELKIPFEEYLAKVAKTEEQVKKDFGKIAEQRVKVFLVLNQIEKEEKIVAEEAEVMAKIGEMVVQYPDPIKARQEMENGQTRLYIEDEIKREKIFKLLGC